MKNQPLLMCIILLITNLSYAQSYEEMMQKQKTILANEPEFIINIEQETYEDGKLNKSQSYPTELIGKNGFLFWSTPDMTVIQNEKSYLMIREEEQVILYSTFVKKIDVEAKITTGFANWDLAMKQYLEAATSIESVDKGDRLRFVVKTDNPMGSEAIMDFDKNTGLMLRMELVQQTTTHKERRLIYSIEYDFDTAVPAHQFDESQFVTTAGDSPEGKGKYKNFEIVYVPVD